MSIIINHANYIYNAGTAFENKALDDVTFSIEDGDFVGIIGRTGSGKSTLLKLMSGLIRPGENTVFLNGEDITDKDFDKKKLRFGVGIVFQYPEDQLFEETVRKDVMFGPKNMGLSDVEASERAIRALELVGLEDDIYDQSPFNLSGGQKRRAAIAGVLAMEPQMLILDEPTAGLDPDGREQILDIVKDLHKKRGTTVIIVSHSMEDVAKYVKRVIVMDNGHIAMDGTSRDIFTQVKELEELGLRAPSISYVMKELRDRGIDVPPDPVTVSEALEAILK